MRQLCNPSFLETSWQAKGSTSTFLRLSFLDRSHTTCTNFRQLLRTPPPKKPRFVHIAARSPSSLTSKVSSSLYHFTNARGSDQGGSTWFKSLFLDSNGQIVWFPPRQLPRRFGIRSDINFRWLLMPTRISQYAEKVLHQKCRPTSHSSGIVRLPAE